MKLTLEEIRVRKTREVRHGMNKIKKNIKRLLQSIGRIMKVREKRRVSASEYQRKKYELINEVKSLCNVYEAFL